MPFELAKISNMDPCMDELETLIKAVTPLIYVVTKEEQRFIQDFMESVVEPSQYDVWLWSTNQGLMRYGEHNKLDRAKGEMEGTWRPNVALDKILSMPVPPDAKRSIFIMRDMHTILGQGIPRQIKDIMYNFSKKTMIITAPELGFSTGSGNSGLPATLDKDIRVLEYKLMDKEKINEYVTAQISWIKNKYAKAKDGKVKTDYSPDEVRDIVTACQGLTIQEIRTALHTSLVKYQRFEPKKIMQIKEQIVAKSQILEFVKKNVDLDDIGGLDAAKKYFQTYKNSFTDEAREFGVEPPTGILLVGVPGCGKSLFAKAICETWGLPGIRLDIGKVMNGLVGGSEARMRDAISQAEALAPAVLWLDEVEKALSGTKSSNFSDAGTMSRVFGTFLTWMQEKEADVIVLATANDISQIPPEFIRRFNEVFFVDLPSPDEREEIFKIHLRKRNRDPEQFDLDLLVKNSDNYTGAEIEKAVMHAIALAWEEEGVNTKLTNEHIITALNDTKPIYQVMGEQIAAIRGWAKGRARYASSHNETKKKTNKNVNIDTDTLDDLFDTGDKKKKTTKKKKQTKTKKSGAKK